MHHADEILFDAILLQHRCDLPRDGDVALDAMLVLEIGQHRSPTAMDGKIDASLDDDTWMETESQPRQQPDGVRVGGVELEDLWVESLDQLTQLDR